MRGGPTIRHLDELEFHVVAQQRLADGRVVAIREKWFEMTPRLLVFYGVWDPGALGPVHGHTGDHTVFILEGEVTFGETVCRAGTHITLEWGDTFGPQEAGPQGCTLYGVVAGDGKPFLHRERWLEFLAERGATEIPIQLPELPAFMDPGRLVVNTLDAS